MIQTILEAIQSIKLWQMAVLLAVVLAGAGGAYEAYGLISEDSEQVNLAEDQQLVPVQRGDLVNEVSVSGNLVYPNRESLTFGIQGTVGDLHVEEGQRVSEGQPLAALDGVTVTSLVRALAQERVDVKNAEEALAETLSPYTDLDVVRAEADVANARLSLKSAEDALAALVDTSPQKIAQSEAAVVDAKISVQDATDALQSLVNGPTNEAVEKILSQIASAETTLANAHRNLKLAKKEWEDKLAASADKVDSAVEAYGAVFIKWLGIELNDQQISMDPNSLLKSWDADLDTLFSPNYGDNDADKWAFGLGLPDDDADTPWRERVIYLWVNFYTGGIAITCPDDVVPFQGECISKDMGDAWNAYEDAIDSLDTVQIQAEKAIAVAEMSVAKSEDSVAALSDTLTELQADADALDVESKERRLDVATAALESAGEDLENLLAGPDQIEMDAKQKQLDVARLTLEGVEEDLAELLADADPLDVALREADLASAIAALEKATQRLAVVVVRAPLDGIVSAVYVESGQTVNPNTPILEIVDPSVIEVGGIVDEIDVLFIQTTAQAWVTMDALPGQVLSGTVSEISTEGTSNQGVVSYPLRIQVEAPEGVNLPEGLSAVASVVIREDRDVLLVPLDALHGTFERPVVLVMNGKVEERDVVLGNSDDFWVVIQGGLAESEMIVMEASLASNAGGLGGLRGLWGGSNRGGFRGGGSSSGSSSSSVGGAHWGGGGGSGGGGGGR